MSANRPVTGWELPQLLQPLHQAKKQRVPEKSVKLRPHFMAIVAYVYRNRYVTINQIQRRFSDVLKSERTARRHTGELESLGYLAPVITRAVSPNFPKVLHVTTRGARMLRQQLAARGKPGHVIRLDHRRCHGCSADHVLHELLTTEFMLNVWQTIDTSDNLELCQKERRSLARQPAFEFAFGRRSTRIEPDAMFVHREQGRGLMVSLVELDTGSMRLQQMTAKLARYEAWANSDAGQSFLLDLYRRHGAEKPRATFRLLVVAADQTRKQDEQRLADLMSLATVFPTVRERAWFTTATELNEQQSLASSLTTEIWHKASQLEVEVPDAWRRQIGRFEYDKLPPKKLRDHVYDCCSKVQRLAMFNRTGI